LIRNLVDNAIRYTPLDGTVRVRVSRATGHCRLCVSDSGPGITPADRDAVLRRFHRLDQGSQPGSGLGLAIVARIAELHGADLDLAAGENAQGLHVTVTWPAAARA
jgi:two-component system sensor histidine kinase QseC